MTVLASRSRRGAATQSCEALGGVSVRTPPWGGNISVTAARIINPDDVVVAHGNDLAISSDGDGVVRRPTLLSRRLDLRRSMSVPPQPHPQPAKRRRHAVTRSQPRTKRAVLTTAVIALVLAASAVAALTTLTEKFGDNVARVPNAFEGLNESARPLSSGGLTFLLVGTDTRSDLPTTGTAAEATPTAGGRSDVLMIARIAADGQTAAVVSIPRDSWVNVPGQGMNKINAAYAFGGAGLLIHTVESLTALHIDHFAVIDFAGFKSVVDSVGGIDVSLSAPTTDRGVTFQQGLNHLDGDKALVYVRQRYGLTNGDLDRGQRQQNALRALLSKAAASGTLNNPLGLYRLLSSIGSFVSVDDTLDNSALRLITQKVRDVGPGNFMFLRAPVAGFGREGSQSVVYLDNKQTVELWRCLQQGTMANYVGQHADDSLGPVTR